MLYFKGFRNWAQTNRVYILALPFIGSVTLSSSLNLLELDSQSVKGDNKNLSLTQFRELFLGSDELIQWKLLFKL